MDNSNQILDDARNSLSDYCINKCGAFCCKNGNLLLQSENEIQVIFKQTNYELNTIIQKTKDNNYTFNLENLNCPKLSIDFKCTIHKDLNKPIICSDYPLIKVKKFIMTSSVCPAFEAKILDKYLEQLKQLGFTII